MQALLAAFRVVLERYDLFQSVMSTILRTLALILLWLYISLFIGWWGLHYTVGDRLWWLGLLNSFVPLFFLPLFIFIPLAPWVRHPLYQSGLLLPLTYGLIVYGPLFLPKASPPHPTDSPVISILTFNVWSGSRQATTLDVIREENLPDIVALQETNYYLHRLIREEFGAAYPYQFYESTLNGRGITTLSRIPLESVRANLLIDLNCRLFRATVEPARYFWLYNCHPQSSNPFTFLGDGRPMAAQMNETFRMRQLLSQAIRDDIFSRGGPAIVVGDFNSTDQNDAYRMLQGVLLDSHREAGWGWGHTFPAIRGTYQELPVFARLVRIDMIRYTKEFTALTSHVSPLHGESDHFPVVATLMWRE